MVERSAVNRNVGGSSPSRGANLFAPPKFERTIGFRFEELHIPRVVAGFDLPLRVVHDRDDRELPWGEGSSIASAWPGAELITTRGLGHYRILHDPEVIRGAVEFLGATS